jgi:hypothetical protein
LAKLLSEDEARRIAANIAKLPDSSQKIAMGLPTAGMRLMSRCNDPDTSE